MSNLSTAIYAYPDLIKESFRKFSSDRLNGPGVFAGGGALFVSFNTILRGNEIKGTLSDEPNTAAAKRPPSFKDL
jgi:hypothetical protein